MIRKLTLILLVFSLSFSTAEARKIKQSLKIQKEKVSKPSEQKNETGVSVSASSESEIMLPDGSAYVFSPDSVSFAGYEKEINSSAESFITTNRSKVAITGMRLKLVYTDMKGRMLHSRTTSLTVTIPPGESRKTDISSWDKQHSYYYYLGNKPRKVATPYKIKILPIAFRLESSPEEF